MRRLRARRAAAVALVAVTLLAVGSCSDGSDGSAAIDGVREFPAFEPEGSRHRPGHLTYDETPPVYGYHSGLGWLRCDAYDEPVPDELAVHSLEHGAVWITYDPGLDARDVARLKDLRGADQEYVLVSPYEGLPSKVVATAWGRQLQVDDASDPRLAEFVDELAGNGLGDEPGAPCRGDGVGPEEGEAALDAEDAQLAASPSASAA